MGVVLDASAPLAFLHEAPDGDQMSPVLDGAHVSAVNWSEVLQKSLQRDVNIDGMQQEFTGVGVVFEPFTPEHAEIAARQCARTRNHDLSLAGGACLALAMDKGLPVMTADRAWVRLKPDVEIQVLR